jgi:hypothetical protein
VNKRLKFSDSIAPSDERGIGLTNQSLSRSFIQNANHGGIMGTMGTMAGTMGTMESRNATTDYSPHRKFADSFYNGGV